MDDLCALIRDILSDELSRLRPEVAAHSGITEEVVEIRSSADLNAFAARILDIGQDGRKRADILAGRHVFCLGRGDAVARLTAHQPLAPTPAPPARARFESGMICERDIASLPGTTRVISVGKTVCLTPLARDELRRKGIKVERTAS